MLLDEGAVIPHGIAPFRNNDGYTKTLEDTSLRVGRVVKFYDPSDAQNVSKKFIEYDVEVNYANRDGPYIKTVYSHCTVSSLFGSVADYIRWTPRIANVDQNNQIMYGSRVLVLCINGNSRFG